MYLSLRDPVMYKSLAVKDKDFPGVGTCVCKRHREVTGTAELQDMWMKIIGVDVEKVGLCHWDMIPLKDRGGSVI